MNTPLDRETVLSDLRTYIWKQHLIVWKFGAWRGLLAIWGFIANALGAIHVPSRASGLVLFLIGSAANLYYLVRMLPLAMDGLCYRIGFVCPYCSKPLEPFIDSAESTRRLREGECYHCHQRIEPPFPNDLTNRCS